MQAGTAKLARNAFFLDTDMLSFLWLCPIQVAKTGDADKGVIIDEGTLKVCNEKGLGVVADLFWLSAASRARLKPDCGAA